MSLLSVGEQAPDFELPALIEGVKRPFRLSSQRGKKNVVLVFYPTNWDVVSARQLSVYQAEKEQLDARRALPVSVCVDSIMNTTAWEREIGPLDFPMCADFWPHGEVCHSYGVFREREPGYGSCQRAIYILDRAGTIQFRETFADNSEARFTDLLEQLNKLKPGSKAFLGAEER
jgi:alkyl hydroperoxide reductase subunit AhpC